MIRKIAASAIVLLASFSIFPVITHAQSVNDFTITNFTATYALTNDGHQGKLSVVEHITADFSTYNHGILRALPINYNGRPLHLAVKSVTNASGTKLPYSTSTDNGNKVLKIGDPSETVTGSQNYVISYNESNVVRFNGEQPYLTINANGTQWEQSFDKVAMEVTLPNNVNASAGHCYVGAYGSRSSNGCLVIASGHSAAALSIATIKPNQTLTIDMRLPVGSFAPPNISDWLRDNGVFAAIGLIVFLVISVWAFRRWYKLGKDLGGRGTIVPEYSSPDGLQAAKVYIINTNKYKPLVLSATIIDLAIRGYIKIIETTENKIFEKDDKTYEFELRNSDFSKLADFEADLLKALFASATVGDRLTINDAKTGMTTLNRKLLVELPKALTEAGYFTRNPQKAGGLMLAFSTTGFIAGVILAGALGAAQFNFYAALPGIGLAAGSLVAFIFSLLMPQRSAKGEAANDQIEGLKLYLGTAEADRIKMLQSPDAPYAPKTSEPEKTVDLFEKLLPYAMVLGVEKQWAKEFESLYTKQPDWYSGNFATFNAVYFANSLSNATAAMQTNFAPSGSSGTGGGGGFSGGGSGGGGGGGW